MNFISASILIFLIAVVLFASRRGALLAMAAGVLCLTQYSSIDLAGFHMYAIRFLEMAGLIRVIARREFSLSRLNQLDRMFLFFYSYLTVISLLRSNQFLAFQVGIFTDAVLCYFTFRGLITEFDDLRWFLRAFVILLIPYVALLCVEAWTAHNLLYFIAGRTNAYVFFRKGRVRCVGSFREYSILGSLGASFFPLYIGLSFSKANRSYAIAGIILSSAIVVLSNSGGPACFAIIGVLGWALWPFRYRMRLIRRATVAMVIALALVMKAPIWYLPTHLKFITSGDAWHRSYLIETAIRHLDKWWLWGMPTARTLHWFTYVNVASDAADITNQYISFGLAAGLPAIALFVWLLIRAVKVLGRKLTEVRLTSVETSEAESLLWGLGVMLAGHIANFTAITYFDQFYVIWFMQLAFISILGDGWGQAYVASVSTRSQPMSFGSEPAAYSKS